MGAHLLADPSLDLADEGDRSEQVTHWLVQIVLDAGLTGTGQLLSRPVPASRQYLPTVPPFARL
jgi:hypothetical protein